MWDVNNSIQNNLNFFNFYDESIEFHIYGFTVVHLPVKNKSFIDRQTHESHIAKREVKKSHLKATKP